MTTAVIDANLALALVVPLQYSQTVSQLVDRWNREAVRLAAPSLWGYEVASGLRKAVRTEILTPEEADQGLADLWGLEIEQLEPTLQRHRQALAWSERLGQAVAYDAQYLVVAEELRAPFWTADRRLAEQAASAGADWVNWIGS